MPYVRCSIGHCASPGIISDLNCTFCGQNFCDDHRKLENHRCLSLSVEEKRGQYQARARSLFKQICSGARRANLRQQASDLRYGRSCQVVIPKSRKGVLAGGLNYHFEITFDDGVQWPARVRKVFLNDHRIESTDLDVASEYATMKRLHSAMRGMVPDAWQVKRNAEDPFCLFVEKVDGRPCRAPFSRNGITKPNETFVNNAIRSYAAFLVRLSDVSFDAVGSIYLDTASNTFSIGPLVSYVFRQSDTPTFLGPFKTMRERFTAQIDFVLKRIEDGVYFPKKERVRLYLMHLEYRTIVERCEVMGQAERYYIKHADDKGDHIMTDDDGHLIAVIDWELAYTTSVLEAFAAPQATIDYDLFWEKCSNELSRDERVFQQAFEELGRPDLARCAVEGKGYRRLFELIGDKTCDHNYLKCTAESLLGRGSCEQYASTEEWLMSAKERYRGHAGFEKVKSMTSAEKAAPSEVEG